MRIRKPDLTNSVRKLLTKIFYLIDHLESNYPRDQNYIIRFAQSQHFDVTIISTKSRFDRFDRESFSGVSVERRHQLLSIRGPNVSVPVFLPTLGSGLTILAGAPIIHAFTFSTFASVLSFIGIRSKIILRSEIGPPLPEINGYRTAFQEYRTEPLKRSLLRFYQRRVNFFTCYTNEEIKSLELLGVPREKIVLLPVMIDFPLFQNLRRRQSNHLVLGCISRLSPIKGVDRLIRPLKRLIEDNIDFEFVLAGRVEQEDYGQHVLESLTSVLGTRFSYLGEVSTPYEFYELVDYAIIPSRSETGAITVLEAMASGKIVIASNIHPINTYVTNRQNGFLFNDEDELYEILRSVTKFDISMIIKNAVLRAKDYDYGNVLDQCYKPLIDS